MVSHVAERAAGIRSVEKDGLPVCTRERTDTSMSPPGGKINRPKTVRNDSCPKYCDQKTKHTVFFPPLVIPGQRSPALVDELSSSCSKCA